MTTPRLSVLGFALSVVLVAAAPVRGQRFSDWSAPVNLGPVVNSPSGDFFPAISKNGLSLYFSSSRPGGYGGWDIYVSQRASIGAPWGPPQNLGGTVNTSADEGGPALSTDGHRLYFASTRTGGLGGNDLYVSRRHDKRDDFGWETAVNLGPDVNTTFNETGPSLFEDAGVSTLYFDSNRPAPAFGPFDDDANHSGTDIYESALFPDETFALAQLVPELSSVSIERQPSVRRDGLEIYFTSDRPGGAGNLDIWVSTRPTAWSTWSVPVNVAAINSNSNNAGPALSFDGTELYFQSPGAAFDLWVSRRTKLTGPGADPDED